MTLAASGETDEPGSAGAGVVERAPRRQRSDAKRNLDSLLDAAKEAFASSGVDAPAKEIADLAGVGVGTVYRHFPQRSDLVIAVLQHEVDACIEEGETLSSTEESLAALTKWLHRYTDFVATKRGLAAALHSGDPAFEGLPSYLLQRLDPVVVMMLDRAAAAGEIRSDVSANDLLRAVAQLCIPGPGGPAYSQRMVALLVDGLRNVSTEAR
jgi:AcrR family transcriptional regulator